MLKENQIRELYEKAVACAAGYAGGDDKLYQAHINTAQVLGQVLEIDEKVTLQAIREQVRALWPREMRA